MAAASLQERFPLNAVAIAMLSIIVFAACAPIADAQGWRQRDARAPETLRIVHDGRDRSALVYDFSGAHAAPVVIVLHGGGGTAQSAVETSQMNRIAARERFIAVYPEGVAGRDRGRLQTWNATHCCAAAMEQNVDDVGFISRLIDDLVASGRADPRRIYVTGVSNGAMMAHRLGRELSFKIAAIAPVVGAVFGDEAAPRGPVPAFIIVGAEDTHVPAAGGPLALPRLPGRRAAAENHDVAPAIQQAEYWARANGCAASATRTTPTAVETSWTGCRANADVVYVVVANNGHAWPGGRAGSRRGDTPTQAYDASAAMWRFFQSHRLAQ